MEHSMATPFGKKIASRLAAAADSLKEGKNLEDRFTCKTIRLDFEPNDYGPDEVKAVREKLRASQAIFAQVLGVSANAVRDWEQGVKSPGGSSRRLMDEIDDDPERWIDWLLDLSATPVAQ